MKGETEMSVKDAEALALKDKQLNYDVVGTKASSTDQVMIGDKFTGLSTLRIHYANQSLGFIRFRSKRRD